MYYRDKLRGKVMLKLRCNPDRRGELDRIWFQDLNAGEPRGIIENDAVDENGDSVLFGYLLDIVEKYFAGMDPNKVDSIVQLALEAWFSKEAADV